jgi:hypothetical protein
MPDKKSHSGGQSGILGSLRDALAAASRQEDDRIIGATIQPASTTIKTGKNNEGAEKMSTPENDKAAKAANTAPQAAEPPPLPSAADAAKEARGGTPNVPPVAQNAAKLDAAPPTTRVVRQHKPSATPAATEDDARTKLVRGRQPVQRGDFNQDPVVGWLVIVGGPGIGSFRPIFEGNNTVGRSTSNRVPVDFGDDTISGEEQAYVRYDSADRSFLLVPNLSKTNVVSINDKRPTSAVPMQAMDVITMGRTQLVFVPFCGPEFDWGELTNLKT